MSTFHDQLPNPVQLVGDCQVVKTPTALAERMLDGFPAEVWSKREYKWLVPTSKSGIFELGIYMRLMKGLTVAIPNWEERRAWIVREMIYSFCPTEACELMTRRFYLGNVWNDIRGYMTLEGNVQHRDFLKARINKEGAIMVKKDKGGVEKYVKFDCVVGNPPYQHTSSDRKGSNAAALYPNFVEKSIELNPKYLSMVIPGKWMTGDGQGTGNFLRMMVNNKNLSSIVAVENSSDWFSGIDLKGGAMYFMLDATKEHDGVIVNGAKQDLSDMEMIVVDPFNLALIKKIASVETKSFDDLVFGLCPHGLATNHNEWSEDKDNSYVCYYNGGPKVKGATRFIDRKLITKNTETIQQWKICTSKTSGKGKDGIASTFIAQPGSVLTHTYVLLAAFNTELEAKNADSYLHSRFAQYLISILKGSINVSKKVFKFLPVLDFTRSYTDQNLYTMFDLTEAEIAHIESTTQNFPMFRAKTKGKKVV